MSTPTPHLATAAQSSWTRFLAAYEPFRSPLYMTTTALVSIGRLNRDFLTALADRRRLRREPDGAKGAA